MKKFNISIILLGLLIVVLAISLFMFNRLDDQEIEKDEVYLVIKTISENTDFWSNVINGAEVAATELGVNVTVAGPEREIYIDDQVALVRDIIKEKPQAIAIAASEYNALAEVCTEVIEAGITLVTFDSDANVDLPHSFVATNNLSAAKRIGHELATLIDGVGKVAIIAHVEGAFTSFEREEGFRQGVRAFKDIEVLKKVRYTDNSKGIAYQATLDIVEGHPDITAIFATNEVTLLGSAEAIRDLGLQDEVFLVGFDMSRDIALLVEQDVIDATMVQKPFNMGYIAIKEALEVSNGKGVEVIDTGAVMINSSNMFLPENQKLIVPIVE